MLNTSCDDQKVGKVRKDMYVENKIEKIQKVGSHFKEILSQIIFSAGAAEG